METDDDLTYLRQYPQGPLYAAVTGYYSYLFGASGIEQAENDVLTGDDARLFTQRLSDIFTGRDPSGGDVVLTLDAAVQEAAMAGLEGVTGAVVALDPSTGAVLALASTPTYDPNLLSSHDARRRPRLRGRAGGRRPGPAAQPGDQRQLPARLGVQGDRVRGRPGQRRLHARHRDPGPGRADPARDLHDAGELRRLPVQQQPGAVR